MKVIELGELDTQLRDRMRAAVEEPVLITEDDQPLLVLRNLLDDDALDELIAQHPRFQESIRRARQQKAEGRVKRVGELHAKYEADAE